MSDNLILTNPSQEESIRVWTGSHPYWGTALSLESYISREVAQYSIPLSRNNGLTPWILTNPTLLPRPIFSSCEILKKRALVRSPDGAITEGIAHGVASVFTEPQERKKGYAGAMMGKIGEMLEGVQAEKKGGALFSVLWSDIGKQFYAKRGWKVFESSHLEFPATKSTPELPENLKIIGFDDLPELAEADEKLLRKQIIDAPQSTTTLVGIMPDLDQLQWHLAREAFACKDLFSKIPTSHGALYKTSSGSRIWAIWKRNHSGSISQPQKNILSFLRFVIEDESVSIEELGKALEVIVQAARGEAGVWKCGKVEMWNPEERVKTLAGGNAGLQAEFVDREDDSISSLRWFGEGSVDNVVWVGNEKYCWC